MIYFDSDMSSTNTVVYFDGNLYLRLRKMSHTIYVAKFEQMIIHQHVHLRRKSQSHAPNEIIPIDKSVIFYKA
jgi:hypothetical protein